MYTHDKRTPSKNDNTIHGTEKPMDTATKCHDEQNQKTVIETTQDQSEHEKQKETNKNTVNQSGYDREKNTTQKGKNNDDKTLWEDEKIPLSNTSITLQKINSKYKIQVKTLICFRTDSGLQPPHTLISHP